ncbi:MAG TPA: sensor domain-containing diguanylate cyclase [Chloroflexota bacterium]|nr:sensor domain-containing diguanylate cyclase [Chloroflexota bacterium]
MTLRQPLTAVLTVLGGLIALAAVIVSNPLVPTLEELLLTGVLAAALIVAYLFPIHIEAETKAAMGTIPTFLLCALLPAPLAAVGVGLGKLGGEIAVRRRAGTYPSDIATQVGRWLVIAVAGSLCAHVALYGSLHTLPLIATAGVLWVGEIGTSPLLLSPALGRPPATVIRVVMREAGGIEGAQNLIGMLAALASLQALWSIVLVVLPGTMMYRTFKRAKDMRERSRGLLASVVETTASGAILLLDPAGRVITANGQAALLYGFHDADEMAGLPVAEVVAETDHDRALDDVNEVAVGPPRTAEYTLRRRDGLTFAGEVCWSSVRSKDGGVTGITCVARDVTARRRAEEEMAYRALHDPLTGLPNRTQYLSVLESALKRYGRDGTPHAVALIDLDGFKGVNDTYGHKAGDLLLQEVAGRLSRTLRDSDTVARLGGDEFALVLPRADRDGARLVADRLHAAMARPIDLDDVQVQVEMSLGIALVGTDGVDSATLLHHADLAMYSAKRRHAAVAFYADEAQQAAG